MSTTSDLFLDYYQLTMSQSFWRKHGEKEAIFELSFRGLPKNRGYLVTGGIEHCIQHIKKFSLSSESVDSLRNLKKFDQPFLMYLENIKFTGEVWSVRDGEIIFANEPVLQIKAPIIQCQLVETILINTVNLHTLLATKCTRVLHAAQGKPVIDFGARRAHSKLAASALAEESHLVGFTGTATVDAGINYSIPLVGTMAHSYVMSFETELEAFRAYAEEFPHECTFLIDTYDSVEGLKNAVKIGLEMEKKGYRLFGVRLDSGDLQKLSEISRKLLDASGLNYVQVIASGGLDEYSIADLERNQAPIDIYGVGTKVSVSADAPWAETIFKMVEFNEMPVSKTSEHKESAPYQKKVYRIMNDSGKYLQDVITAANSTDTFRDGEELLIHRIRTGNLLEPAISLTNAQQFHRNVFDKLPARYKALSSPPLYPVTHLIG